MFVEKALSSCISLLKSCLHQLHQICTYIKRYFVDNNILMKNVSDIFVQVCLDRIFCMHCMQCTIALYVEQRLELLIKHKYNCIKFNLKNKIFPTTLLHLLFTREYISGSTICLISCMLITPIILSLEHDVRSHWCGDCLSSTAQLISNTNTTCLTASTMSSSAGL